MAGTRDGAFGPDGAYWLGPRLSKADPKYAATLEAIKANFLVHNLLGSVVETHVDAFLGLEPDFELYRAQAVSAAETDALTPWFAAGVHETLQIAAKTLQYNTAGAETSSVLRLYVPKRTVLPNGTVPREPLDVQLRRRARLQHVRGGQAGALREDGDQIAGWYAYRAELDGQPTDVLELSALDTEFAYQNWRRLGGVQTALGYTVVQLRTGHDYGTILGEGVYPLGGHLTIFEMSREPLVSEDAVWQQAGLNTGWTYLLRHAGASAFLERVILNGLPKGKWVDAQGQPNPEGPYYEAEPLEVGSGTTNFYQGMPGKDGSIANPQVAWREPSTSEPLLKNIDAHRRAILELTGQSFRLIAGDSTSSGVARQQAANEFAASLRPSQAAVKAGLTWALETALRLAGYLSGGDYTDVTADVRLNSRPTIPTPDEMRLTLDLRDGGLLSTAEAMTRVGVIDPAAMVAQIAEEGRQPEAQNVAQ